MIVCWSIAFVRYCSWNDFCWNEVICYRINMANNFRWNKIICWLMLYVLWLVFFMYKIEIMIADATSFVVKLIAIVSAETKSIVMKLSDEMIFAKTTLFDVIFFGLFFSWYDVWFDDAEIFEINKIDDSISMKNADCYCDWSKTYSKICEWIRFSKCFDVCRVTAYVSTAFIVWNNQIFWILTATKSEYFWFFTQLIFFIVHSW